MTQTKSTWRTLYKIGGVAALLTVFVMLSESLITLLPGGSVEGLETATTVIDWFRLYHEQPWMALRNLGLVNLIATTLSIPMILALHIVHQKSDPAFATLALALSLIGMTVYLSSNTSFPMLTLSWKYHAAETETQRMMLAAAGEAMLAQAESHTPGTFVGFFYIEIASILMSIVMLRNQIFSKTAGIAGILGYGSLLVFEILASLVPTGFSLAMIFVALGGLASLVWSAMIGQKLLKLSKTEPSYAPR